MKALKTFAVLLTLLSGTASAQGWQHSTKTDCVRDHQREFVNETDDCVPVAVANALHIDYYEARQLCTDYLGRCSREGVPLTAIYEGFQQLLDDAGFRVSDLYVYEGIPFTVGDFLLAMEGRTAIVFIPGHALVIDDGVLVDWFIKTIDAPVMFLLVIEQT